MIPYLKILPQIKTLYHYISNKSFNNEKQLISKIHTRIFPFSPQRPLFPIPPIPTLSLSKLQLAKPKQPKTKSPEIPTPP